MAKESGGECEGDRGMKDNNILINIERDMDNCKRNVESKFNEEKDYITRMLKKLVMSNAKRYVHVRIHLCGIISLLG